MAQSNKALKACFPVITAIFLLASPGGVSALPTLPSTKQTPDFSSVEDAIVAANLTTLHAALDELNLISTLDTKDMAITLLAPTNEAFKLAAEELNVTTADLLDSAELKNIIDTHIISTALEVDDLIERRKIKTESGIHIEVTVEEVHGKAMTILSGPINSADIITEDITAAKSIIQIINAVLLPEL